MYRLLISIHLIVCITMILVIIFQSSKGTEMGAVFGGGASQTAFGSQGSAGFMEKTTIVCAIIFMVTSISLAILSTNKQKSLMQGVTSTPPIEQSIPESAPEQAPATSQPESTAPPAQAPATQQQQSTPAQAPAAPQQQPSTPQQPPASAQPGE